MGRLCLKGMHPGGVKVDRIYQYEPGPRIDSALGDQILDLALRLVADPVVDGFAGFFWCACKVQEPQPGTIVFRQEVEKHGEELIVLLAPDGIGDAQPETLCILAFGASTATRQLDVQGVEGRMQTVLCEVKVEGLRHLMFGLTASTRICHRQRQRDAVGRVEEVALVFSQNLVQVKGERAVAGN